MKNFHIDLESLLTNGFLQLPLPNSLPFDLKIVQNDLFDYFLSGENSTVNTFQEFSDLRSLFYVGRRESLLPSSLLVLHSVYDYMDFLGKILMKNLAPAFSLAENYFVEQIIEAPSFLRPTFYWPHRIKTVVSEPHVDMSLITVLLGATHEGLEIYRPNSKKWIEINNLPNSIVITFGRLFELITDNLVPATLHRVRSRSLEARLSLPYFVHARNEVAMLKIDFNGIVANQPKPITFEQYLTVQSKLSFLQYQQKMN